MTHAFNELAIGGVLLAPVISYVGITLFVMLAIRPVLRRTRFTSIFVAPAIAEFSLYVVVFSLLTLFA